MPKDDPGKTNGGFKGFGGANADKLGRFDAGKLGNHGNGNAGDQNGQGGQNGAGNMNGKATGNEKSGDKFNQGDANAQGSANGDAMARESERDGSKSQGGFGSKPSAGGGASNDKFGGQSGDALSNLNKGMGGFGQTGSDIGDAAGDQAKDSLKGALQDDPVDNAFSGDSDKNDSGNDLGVNDESNPDLANDLKGAAEDGQGLPAGLKSLGSKLPEPVKKAGGKAGQVYAKFNGAAVKQVMKFGGKGGMKKKMAQAIVHAFLGTTLGIGGFAAYQIFDSQQPTLDSSFVCDTTNTSGNAFEVDNSANSDDLGSGPTSSQNTQQENAIKLYGNYQDKNSNAHKIYEMIYANLLRQGLDKTQAAGIAGGVAQEDGVMDPIQGNIGGIDGTHSDGGFGFFQVTPSVSGHNLQEYAKAHNVNLYANSSQTLNGDDPKDRAKAMIGMEEKVQIEVQEYVEDFVKPGKYLNYKGTYQRMAELGAELEAHGTVGYGTADNSNVAHRTAGARFVMENYSNLPDLQNIGGKIDSADANAANSESESNSACNTAGNTDNGASGSIIDTAKEFIGKVPYNQAARGTITNPPGGQADCSSFVWFIFKTVGYKVPDVPWNTSSMVSSASSPYVEVISAENARKGDAFVINKGTGLGDDGHTGILLQDWHGPNTMVINEGGSQTNVNISTFGEACYPTLTGGDIKFVRPIHLNK